MANRLVDILFRKKQLHEAFRRVFDTPDGKIVLRQIMKDGFVFRTTFVKGDPHETALNEGSRRLALSIVRFFERDHKGFIEQLEEGIKHESEQ